jgi:hypothetical protein
MEVTPRYEAGSLWVFSPEIVHNNRMNLSGHRWGNQTHPFLGHIAKGWVQGRSFSSPDTALYICIISFRYFSATVKETL